MPCEIALRVVSLPATASRITKKPNSSADRLSPSTCAWVSLVTMSSRGHRRRSSAISMLYPMISAAAAAGSAVYSGSS